MSYLLVLTTVATQKEARFLSDLILAKRVAACVQISGPVESVYWWKNKRCQSREFQLWIKTKSAAYKTLEKLVRSNHSSEVPEIIAFPVSKGLPDYLKWISAEVR